MLSIPGVRCAQKARRMTDGEFHGLLLPTLPTPPPLLRATFAELANSP